MAMNSISKLEEPWVRDELVEVRTGKAKPVFGLPVQSAIFKSVRYGSVSVDLLGCRGDEHVYEFHGGPDKALLQYCSQHYDTWSEELPGSAHLFRIGGFGENLVARRANERNTCIGDIIRIGPEVIAQVSLPRQPCYKLNHRFQEKNLSRFSQERSRTGWYYRIIKGGSIQAGDELVLLERPNPHWTVARVQHYLYIEKENSGVMKELADLDALGEQRLLGDSAMALDMWAEYRLIKKVKETPTVISFKFTAVHPRQPTEPVLPGTHVRLKLGGRLIRAYSVVEGSRNQFTLGVALDRQSTRGGSLFLHETLQEGDTITISNLAATFPLAEKVDCHILIAGGIGITGLLASAQRLQQTNQDYHLHYVVRSLDEEGSPFDVSVVLQQADSNAHIYCCSGERLMKAVCDTAAELGLPNENLHFESFQVNSTGDPFTVELVESNKEMEVAAGDSLLDTLRSAGFDIPSTCEAGNCGTCRVGTNLPNSVQNGIRDNVKRVTGYQFANVLEQANECFHEELPDETHDEGSDGIREDQSTIM
ncbi:uncharacterized protein N7458_007228 [Penicillium daleae]|uniref:MOSC domain-containing protein n=1 Tax=Penicillium daleae TaxID=63821 RepID=A0AAD6C6S5_9EURO|nr:uncharacterized protein N7458_007228 [Penicillium daleae]KAJ5450779.1 hypothetical protein N7458_007228 [Penicillium daleae]